jgi:hypothetical protein
MAIGEIATLAIQGLVLVLIAVAVFNGALAWPTDRHLTLFASTYEIPVTAANRTPLARYIWWSRAWRIGGAMLAFVVARIIEAFNDPTGFVDYAGVLALGVGYAIGATVGEAFRPRPARPDRPQASLDVRSITDYVRPWVLIAVAVSTVTLIVTLLRFLRLEGLDPRARRRDPMWVGLDPPTAIALVTLLVLGAGATLLLGQFLARRPLRIESSEIAAVEHAIRSSAIVSLTGCGLLLTGVGTAFFMVQVSWLSSDTDIALRSLHGWIHAIGLVATFTGLMLSWKSIPRFAPFSRRLPAVPPETA